MQVSEEPDQAVDLDGIKHSFNRSMETVVNVSALLGSSGLTAPQNNSVSRLFNESENEQDVAQGTSQPLAEGFEHPDPELVGNSLPNTAAERTCTSPFSKFLEETQGNLAHDQTGERTLVQSTPLETSLPTTINYATSTDLLALERKIEVLVAEATTTISSRLLAQIANPTTVPDGTAPTPEANSPEGGLPNLVASTSIGPRDPSVTPMKRRRGKTPVESRVNKSPSSPPEDQFVTQKRPRPRLQMYLQMFRKHPVFRFFVTAPIDSEKNPHKWRCRVCHLELSLKTKGSLEILSHYRTEAHLTREHRIRMETPGLPLFDSNELELVGPALEDARAKAEQELPIAPVLGECYLMPGQRKLPADTAEFDLSPVVCSQIGILLSALQNGGTLSSLISLWTNLGLEVRGPAKVPQYNWNPERIFVSSSLFHFLIIVLIVACKFLLLQGILTCFVS